MTPLQIIILVLCFAYVFYIIYEKVELNLLRKKFKLIVHVNGIRGKSTTTRLIDAGLRNCGYKVFSKTTGTLPTMIDVHNNDVSLKRHGPANIREQIKMLKIAAKQGADAIVLECMAVNPELQRICEEHILRADICVITNVREDHIGEMGDTLEDLARSLSLTTPKRGVLITNNGDYNEIFRKAARHKQSQFVIAKPFENENTLQTFSENIAVALEVARILQLNEKQFMSGMEKYHKDIGAYAEYRVNNTVLLNGFSINDITSIKMTYEEICTRYDKDKISLLINNRDDRPTRTIQMIDMLNDLEVKKIILVGSNINFVIKTLKRRYQDKEIVVLEKIEDLLNEEVIFGIGNIANKGMKILEFFKKGSEVKWVD